MPWPKKGATQHHAQLGLLNKGRVIKGLIICNSWDVNDFGPAKWSGPTLS